MKRFGWMLVLCACTVSSDPDDLRAGLTPDVVARLTVPMILVHVPDRQIAATLVPNGQNGPVRSWRSRDAVQLSYDGDVLVATRGLGDDLMAADVQGTVMALRGGSPRYTRLSTGLNGAFDTVVTTWNCMMTQGGTGVHRAPAGPVAITVMVETCTGPAVIENRYHRAADGTIWWSRQWVSTGVGALETERIRP